MANFQTKMIKYISLLLSWLFYMWRADNLFVVETLHHLLFLISLKICPYTCQGLQFG